jgi:hypothetical protein
MLNGLGLLGSIFVLVGLGATIAPLDIASHHVGPRAVACLPADQCCRICSTGKACGNSCIRRSYECHKGRGCACDADQVCN